MGKSYVGEIGKEIVVDCGIDLSAFDPPLVLSVRKPDGTEVEWTGSAYDTTKIRYVTVEDDLDQAGNYHVQADVDGLISETAVFKIHKRYG